MRRLRPYVFMNECGELYVGWPCTAEFAYGLKDYTHIMGTMCLKKKFFYFEDTMATFHNLTKLGVL